MPPYYVQVKNALANQLKEFWPDIRKKIRK